MNDDAHADLRARTRQALAELDELGAADRAASEALRVARLTADTLRRFWLPALEAPPGADGGRPNRSRP